MIEDGSGRGYKAKVNANQRLFVASETITNEQVSVDKGDAYNVNTGVITLTDSVDTPVFYLKNNDPSNLHIVAIAVGLGPSTGGSGGIPKITVVRNPTAGTIISNATDVDMKTNRNFASSKILTNVLTYKGATGSTMTGGEDFGIFYQTTSGRLYASIDVLIAQGSSFGVKIDPQPSNTSMDCYFAAILHFEDEENF